STLTDGHTPTGLEPGAPAGSYALSGFDNVNLYNGNLNFRLPLLPVGGRGGAHYTMLLPIEQHWGVEREAHATWVAEDPIQTCGAAFPPGNGAATLIGRNGAGGSTDCQGGIGVVQPIELLTRLTFTLADGTEIELRDQLTDGQRWSDPSPCTLPRTQSGAS